MIHVFKKWIENPKNYNIIKIGIYNFRNKNIYFDINDIDEIWSFYNDGENYSLVIDFYGYLKESKLNYSDKLLF